MRTAREEEIKMIKKGDTFLARENADGKIHTYKAAEDARFNGRRWSVFVEAYTRDEETGEYIKNAARAFDDCQIVVDERFGKDRTELKGLLKNLGYLSRPDEKEEICRWDYLHTFLHIYDQERLENLLEILKANGYISFKKTKKGISDILVHKNEL